jgi:hypothetical protein
LLPFELPFRPVALRTSSPSVSYLAVFLQGLYAALPFRRSVLAFKPTSDDHERADYAGYWKGQPEWSVADLIGSDDATKVILALQRLFAFMSTTRRKWINIEEMVRIFDFGTNDLAFAREPVSATSSKDLTPLPLPFMSANSPLTIDIAYSKSCTKGFRRPGRQYRRVLQRSGSLRAKCRQRRQRMITSRVYGM